MFTVIGCRDIIEEDLSEATIALNAPGNNLTSTSLTQTFWWDEVVGATFYNIQIVSPNFNNI